MIAATPPIVPEPSLPKVGDELLLHCPADWTCYSAGAHTPEWVVKAAEDSTTSSSLLAMLAENCNIDVRMAVADNQNALPETLMILAQDASNDLRYQLAENHNIDRGVLKLLAEDEHPYVAQRAQKTLRRLDEGAAIGQIVPISNLARFAYMEAAGIKSRRRPAI